MEKNSFLFKKYSIFKNNTTLIYNIYLRVYCNIFYYKPNGKSLYNLEHAIFISSFHINKIINSCYPYLFEHIYFHQIFHKFLLFYIIIKNQIKNFQVSIYY